MTQIKGMVEIQKTKREGNKRPSTVGKRVKTSESETDSTDGQFNNQDLERFGLTLEMKKEK